MMFTAEPVSAPRALSMGLVNQVVPADQLEAEVARMAALIATRAPGAVALLKRVVRQGMEATLDGGLALERESLATVFGSADYAEGLAAFAEKRAPRFGTRQEGA